MNIITQIFGNIGSSENSLKDLLTILATSITIIVAIYYALNVFSNIEKEEKIMNIYGYNKKSINVPLILFIIVYSIFPILGLIFYKLDNILLESSIMFTYITIFILFIFFPILKLNTGMIMNISILILFAIRNTIILCKFLGISSIISSIISSSIIGIIGISIIGIIGIIGISIIGISISSIIDRKIFSNKSLDNNYITIYLFIPAIIKSCLFCNFIIYFQLFIPLEEEVLKKINFLFFLLYPLIGLLIFNSNYTKYKKEKELKQIAITLKKDITESNQDKYENKIGVIISETNDDIVFEIDEILHRYRKSDIFCIKEYQNPYSSILKELNDFSQRIQTNLGKIKDKEIISNCKSIKDNILKLNKMNDNHYDSIINTMKEDILKLKDSLSKIEKNKTTEYNTNINFYLSAINNRIDRIDKIAKKKQELEQEQEKKKQEQENQKPPTI